MPDGRAIGFRAPSMGRRLLVFAILLILPGTLAVLGLLLHEYRLSVNSARSGALLATRALATAVDHQLLQAEAGVAGLAASSALPEHALERFHREATALVQGGRLRNVALVDAQGRHVLNTLRSHGSPLPPLADDAPALRALRSGATVYALARGAVTGEHIAVVSTPVRFGPDVAYAVAGVFGLERLQALLADQHLPAGWIAAVLDSTGRVAARTAQPQVYVGREATAELRAALDRADSGSFDGQTLDGIHVLTVYARAPHSRWSVVIGVPTASLEGGYRRSLALLVLGTALLLAAAAVVAGWYGAQIARSMGALVAASRALGRGEPVQLPATLHLREADEVGRAMAEAGATLEQARLRVKERESGLVQRNEALQQFAFAASHDLRAPLRSIRGFLEVLLLRAGDRLGEHAALVDRSLRAVDRLQAMTQDLLAIARLEHEGPVRVPVDLNAVLDGCRMLLAAELEQHGGVLESHGLPVVQGHPQQLQQLFNNLVVNALRYRRPDTPSVVRVTAQAHARGWTISVSDNGQGIGAESLEAIFQPFHRLHTDAATPGSGLGLAICRRIVELHGGTIRAESVPGEGSTFRFTLKQEAP